LRFLGRAKKFLQDLGTEPEAKVQNFNVACAAGHRVRGERTEGYQALRCPVCGEGVFVLPRSPLPEPPAPPGTRRSRGGSRRAGGRVDEGPVELTDADRGAIEFGDGGAGGGEAEIVWDDEPEGADQPGAPASPRFSPEDLAAAEIDAARRRESAAAGTPRPARTKPDGTAATGARTRREPAGSPGAARPARPGRAPAPAAVEVKPRLRRRSRAGLIFVLLTLLVVGAVGWRAMRYRREGLPRVIERGRVEGLPALDEGDFDRANQLLSAARAAVDELGGAVEDAEMIRQAAKEAAVFNDRCPETLEDLLAEAGRMDKDAWADKFATLYKGRYYIFDTLVDSTPEDGGTGAYDIGYVVLPPGEASRFGEGAMGLPDKYAPIDLAGFELFEMARPPRETHVTFGARLQSMAYDDEKKQWVVRLEPKSGVFIEHTKALRVIGLPTPESIDMPREDKP
jgi:hypothetical protein